MSFWLKCAILPRPSMNLQLNLICQTRKAMIHHTEHCTSQLLQILYYYVYNLGQRFIFSFDHNYFFIKLYFFLKGPSFFRLSKLEFIVLQKHEICIFYFWGSCKEFNFQCISNFLQGFARNDVLLSQNFFYKNFKFFFAKCVFWQ